MHPASEDLEAFHDELRKISAALSKLAGKEVTNPQTLDEVARLCRRWLQLSRQLREVPGLDAAIVDTFDEQMSAALAATKTRVRATALKKRLDPVSKQFLESIVIPLISYEGSPTQVAARQLRAEFEEFVSGDEMSYVDEAARCLSQHCNRATMILLWAAGMSRIHSAIQKIGFEAFNKAAMTASSKRGNPNARLTKNLTVGSLADLQRARDFDLLVVGMEVWGYDLQSFEELERLLSQRNSAAHPGLYQPNSLEVHQFAGKLSRFVFSAVPL